MENPLQSSINSGKLLKVMLLHVVPCSTMTTIVIYLFIYVFTLFAQLSNRCNLSVLINDIAYFMTEI